MKVLIKKAVDFCLMDTSPKPPLLKGRKSSSSSGFKIKLAYIYFFKKELIDAKSVSLKFTVDVRNHTLLRAKVFAEYGRRDSGINLPDRQLLDKLLIFLLLLDQVEHNWTAMCI